MKNKTAGYAANLYAEPETALLAMELMENADTAVRLPRAGARWARLTVFCPTAATAQQSAGRLRAILRAGCGRAGRVSCTAIPTADWQENWKRFFPARRVSPRLVVKPPWRNFKTRPGDCVVEVDPGLSFGTGLHPTTRGCLRLLDELTPVNPESSFLDIGCGSGILAIAATRLGCRPVLALDNDPQAVRATRMNRDANGLRRRLQCRRADILRMKADRRFDLVAANLLAGLLIEAAPVICALVADGGRLIISGILTSQYSAVRRAYRNRGFREIKNIVDGEWQTGSLVRKFWRS